MPDQSVLPSVPWWVRVCRWVWKQRGLLWTTMLLGIALNIVATWLVTPFGVSFSNSPLGTILNHPWISVPLGISLLVLTGLVGWVNHRYSVPATQGTKVSLPTPQERSKILRAIRQDYRRRLAQSLQGMGPITLGLNERTDVAASSAQLVFRRSPATGTHPLPLGTSIVQVYDEVGNGLLILGAPGSGKTTLLLSLALELLTRAEDDMAHPITVILNLSSWVEKKLSLEAWAFDQLRLIYGIPVHLGTAWIASDQGLLLLDGLDEVEASARFRCIEAINRYRTEHLAPVVICSRSDEYLNQEVRLLLPDAVEIQPLQEQQVASYLKQFGKPMNSVRAILRTNAILRQLMTTPLLLSMVILTYRDKAVKDLPQLGTAEEQQQQIFEQYIMRMLNQRTQNYTSHQ